MSSEGIVGQILDGKYSIEKQLGKGGMGTVYLSTHIGTGRPVAVKVIAPEFMKRSEFVERFRREAKAAGRLRHPNVVDVTDFGFSKLENDEDAAYLVMEYLDGCTLGEVLDEEKKLPVDFTIDILEQVCSAVEEAHKQGIIHRDLKPDNIWIEPNQRGGYTVKVLDFGIAKLEETKLEGVEETIQIPFAGGVDTKVSVDKQTIADNRSETVADKRNSTIISENETMALVEESKTLVSASDESKTIIQPIESKSSKDENLEDGTAILPANQTQSIDSEDSKGTKIITDENEDANSTKVISGKKETDKSLQKEASTTNLTRAGAVLGTPLYMSPEQCRGKKLTPHSDIYSIAVIAYQMLEGKLPFTGDYVKVMNGHKNESPPVLKAKKVPKKLKGIVMRSLSKETESRPKTAEAFASKMRANSEGLGTLLRRAIVIYSERLPKFLSLAILTFIPLILLTVVRVGFGILRGFGLVEDDVTIAIISASFGISTFFIQIVTSALLVGMITLVVAKTIAFPLRAISLRATFNEVKKRWKALIGTVTISTLLAMSSWVIGALIGILGFLTSGLALFLLFDKKIAAVFAGITTALITVSIGVTVSCLFMLVAPSIMMEGISGMKAFKRSVGLARRSFKTVFSTSLLVYFIPVFLALLIGFSLGSIINNHEMKTKMTQMKKEGVKPMTEEELKKEEKATNISINGRGVRVNDGNKNEESMSKGIFNSIKGAIFELIWTPLALLISSFTSVVTALIYFKTRQAGGESMQELLGKLDDSDQPQSKWQQRVRERLIQSGKITGSTTTNPSKS